MAHFICFLNWTNEGATKPQDIADRHAAAEHLAEELGGNLVGGYVTTGQYDVVAILDMPDGDAMAKFALTIGQRGQARTTTVRAFSQDELQKIVSDL